MAKSIDQIIHESLTKTENAIRPGFDERQENYSNEKSVKSRDQIIFDEARTFTLTAIGVILKALVEEGYLNNPNS